MVSLDCGPGSHTTMGPDVLFPLFKGAPFLPPGDKAQEPVSDMLVGTWGEEWLAYQRPGGGGPRERGGRAGRLRARGAGCGGEIALRSLLGPRAPSLGTEPLYPARMGGRPDNVALYLV